MSVIETEVLGLMIKILTTVEVDMIRGLIIEFRWLFLISVTRR
jgi:hypothetical protein